MISSTPEHWRVWPESTPACWDQCGSATAQIHLTVIRARAGLVSARTALVNAARGLTKSYGERLPKCGTQQMNREIAKGLSEELRDVLGPLFQEIESLNERIAEYDQRIEQIAKKVYPHVALLKQVKGVGTLIALTYVLTLDDPHRFRRSRDAGCFVGLRPGRRNSGMSQPQLHISKEGDRRSIRNGTINDDLGPRQCPRPRTNASHASRICEFITYQPYFCLGGEH
jgi:transposase